MKKVWIVSLGIVAVVGTAVGMGVMLSGSGEMGEFRLAEEDYGDGELVELTAEEFAEKVAEKKSFVVIARMTVCPAEFPLADVARRLASEEDVKIYSLLENEFRKTSLAETVKYLPSAAVYQDGELVKYLDAEADEDVEYYKSVEGLKKWIGL